MAKSLQDALEQFAKDITKKFKVKAAFQPEDQLKPVVSALVIDAGKLVRLDVDTVTEVHAQGSGRPDIGVTVKSLLNGHIELKAPGKGADPTRLKGSDKLQWEKFKDLPNLLYTDGNSWALYRNGDRIGNVVHLSGDATKDGRSAVTRTDADNLQQLLHTFLAWEPIVPSEPRALADTLAPLCRFLRRDVLTALANPSSNLSILAEDWRTTLFADASDEEFADAYAQTLTYALLLARLSGGSDLSIGGASKTIRAGHRLLSDTLKVLGDDDARDETKVAVDLLERVLGALDPVALIKKSKGDPWLYFYEDFLAAYDPKMRKDRGVYYTPVEVVRAQVRLIAELLGNNFGADFSFVDPNVITLDPATGTGTYILAAINHGLNQIQAAKGAGMKVGAATTAAQNVHAFELLVGPYAVAHMRVTQLVLSAGGTLPRDGAHVYLTDTLESPNAAPSGHLPLQLKRLADEHKRARQVKLHTPVFVCLGNPPYDRETDEERDEEGEGLKEKRKGGWVRFGDQSQGESGILEDFLEPLRSAGLGVHAKNLYNDYVYFWRWAIWKIFENKEGPGIVSFITASSYLRGPGFIGMRKVMRETFDELWIIDLQGDNAGARKSENVFAIQTPVAIAVAVRYEGGDKTSPAAVHYTRIDGTQIEKLEALDRVCTFSSLPWDDCPDDLTSPFLPIGNKKYRSWPLLTDLFPWQESGLQFKRSWPIGESKKLLEARWRHLISAGSDKPRLFHQTRDRKTSKKYPHLDGASERSSAIDNVRSSDSFPPIVPYGFRSFDRQWMIADSRVGDFLRPVLHQTYSDQQIFLTSLLTEVIGEGPSAVVTDLIPDLHHFRGSFGGRHVIPLWRDPAATKPNLPAKLLQVIGNTLGNQISPEDFFAYCYAVLFSPAYVQTFWDELMIPGPHVPITKDAKIFSRAVGLGRKLINLHTFGHRFVPKGKRSGQIPKGRITCTKGTSTSKSKYPETFTYNPSTETLYVGDGVFSNVSSEVYEFSVSGLKVVQSWLSYRMLARAGRASSDLDKIRPEGWSFDGELLDMLWVIEATIELIPECQSVLRDVLKNGIFRSAELPAPNRSEREAPHLVGKLPLFEAMI